MRLFFKIFLLLLILNNIDATAQHDRIPVEQAAATGDLATLVELASLINRSGCQRTEPERVVWPWPTVLHIATHVFFFPDLKQPKNEPGTVLNRFEQSEDPLLRAGLIMAGANYVWNGGKPIEGVDDGILTAGEVAELNLSGTELVVLSACETALGKV